MGEVTRRTRARRISDWPRRSQTGDRNEPSQSPPQWEYQNQQLTTLYEALTARVGHRDALLWQSPTLAMTAQAFLLTIALGHESRPIARLIAAFLGVAVAYMSVQLMLKHRMYMWNDQVTKVSLERMMKMPTSAADYDKQLAHLEQDTSQPPLREPKRKKWLTKFVSVHVWIWGLGFFGLINFILLVFAGADLIGVACPKLPDITGQARCWVEL